MSWSVTSSTTLEDGLALRLFDFGGIKNSRFFEINFVCPRLKAPCNNISYSSEPISETFPDFSAYKNFFKYKHLWSLTVDIAAFRLNPSFSLPI